MTGAALAVLGLTWSVYAVALRVRRARRGRGSWPWSRTALFALGTAAGTAALTGPLAEHADSSFTAHMVTHLLLGMVGPLLLVRSAPVTLALGSLPVASARALVRLLASRPVRFLAAPVTAAVGTLAGLWTLYTTPLLVVAEEHPALHVLVHLHVFGFGYLLAASLVGLDPDRHRARWGLRAVVLVAFQAGHGILAKHLYAAPPTGVDPAAARTGAMVMYYGGDLVDLTLLVLLCAQLYAKTAPGRRTRPAPVRPVDGPAAEQAGSPRPTAASPSAPTPGPPWPRPAGRGSARRLSAPRAPTWWRG